MPKQLENIADALTEFEIAANQHGEATEQGNYKEANKNYGKIAKVITFLKEQNSINELLPLIEHPSLGVRLWASTYLLPVKKEEAIRELKNIIRGGSFCAFTAETTLSEWKKGNLNL
jgi:Domain of unknown function (DUF2019)